MNDNIEIDLKELFKVILKRLWIVVLCAVVLGVSVYVYTVNFVTPQYQASVTLYVNNNSSNTDGTYITSADLAVALRLVGTYVNIIQSDTVLEKVIAETGFKISADQLRGMISAEVMDETEIFKVTVKAPNAQMAADLANAIATVAPSEIVTIIEGSSAKIIDYAKVPKSYSSPNYTLNTIVGAVVGAGLAIVVLLMQMLMDARIKSEDDLTKICAIPVLGVIPQLHIAHKSGSKKIRWWNK